jgi:hypothetical protein
MECMTLLRQEIDNPNGEVSDVMIATVVNIAFSEVSPLILIHAILW